MLLGLIVGKPLGITLFALCGVRWMKLEMPSGMDLRQIFVLGCIASLGFTVALFVATAAFPQPGPIQDSVKMGALASFFAPVVAFAAAAWLRVGQLGRFGRAATELASEGTVESARQRSPAV